MTLLSLRVLEFYNSMKWAQSRILFQLLWLKNSEFIRLLFYCSKNYALNTTRWQGVTVWLRVCDRVCVCWGVRVPWGSDWEVLSQFHWLAVGAWASCSTFLGHVSIPDGVNGSHLTALHPKDWCEYLLLKIADIYFKPDIVLSTLHGL